MELASSVFIDTSFFIALLNSRDDDHELAVRWQARMKSAGTRKVTSEYVLCELADGLARLRYRQQALTLIRLVLLDPTFQVVPSTSDLFHRALFLYESRADKEWGLTDCSTFVIMEQLGMIQAMTTDHHFRQSGFQALLLV